MRRARRLQFHGGDLREGGERYDVRGLRGLARLRASAAEALARDRACAVQLVELFALDAYRLLTTPAEPVRPSQVTQRDALAALQLLVRDLDLLYLAHAFGGTLRIAAGRLHTRKQLLGEHSSRTPISKR